MEETTCRIQRPNSSRSSSFRVVQTAWPRRQTEGRIRTEGAADNFDYSVDDSRGFSLDASSDDSIVDAIVCVGASHLFGLLSGISGRRAFGSRFVDSVLGGGSLGGSGLLTGCTQAGA